MRPANTQQSLVTCPLWSIHFSSNAYSLNYLSVEHQGSSMLYPFSLPASCKRKNLGRQWRFRPHSPANTIRSQHPPQLHIFSLVISFSSLLRRKGGKDCWNVGLCIRNILNQISELKLCRGSFYLSSTIYWSFRAAWTNSLWKITTALLSEGRDPEQKWSFYFAMNHTTA